MRHRRAGITLIELMIAITVTGILLALAAGMIHLLLKLDRGGRTASEEASDLARLARDFRADAHASAKAQPAAIAPDRLRLELEGSRAVEYEVKPDVVARTATDGAKVLKRETYRRPPRTSVRWEIEADGPRPLAVLVVDRPPDGRDESSYRDRRVVAELGRDRRLNPRSE
jgi:prepilin-type N-terminal cleavage/methylation domain-containing protein